MTNTIEILDKNPFKRIHIGAGINPSSYLDSLSYYEQVAYLTNYIIKTIIPKLNETIEVQNNLVTEFEAVKKEAEEAKLSVEELSQKVLDLTAQLAVEIRNVKDYSDAKNAELSTLLQTIIDSEVARLDDKIEHFPISSVLVQNQIRGMETSVQVYLDDITSLLRSGAITAQEYDNLELTASEYDIKEITASEFDFWSKFILTGSYETASIILYNSTGQNIDGCMTQKAVTDLLPENINTSDWSNLWQ